MQRTRVRAIEQAENANGKENMFFASLCLLLFTCGFRIVNADA